MTHNFNCAKAHSFLSKLFCSLMVATVIAGFASCDFRKKFNVQEFEGNFRAAVAIEKHQQESNKHKYTLPQSVAHIHDPYGSAKRAIEIFDNEISIGQLVFIDHMGENTDVPLAISAKAGKENIGRSYVDSYGVKQTYLSKNGILYRGWGYSNFGPGGSMRYMDEIPVFFISTIKNDEGHKKYFQNTYGISEEMANYLGELSYTKRTKHFIEDYEKTVLSLTKPELVSESESAIVHKVKDINSGYVFYVTEEWSADGTINKKSFKLENENKKNEEF